MAGTKITVRHDGSLRVDGDFEIVDPEGKPFGLAGRTNVALCRCGHSQTKPFCDGTHRTVGFRDQVQARDLPPPQPKPGV
jgi:CDGSH-type Zn-finger protein